MAICQLSHLTRLHRDNVDKGSCREMEGRHGPQLGASVAPVRPVHGPICLWRAASTLLGSSWPKLGRKLALAVAGLDTSAPLQVGLWVDMAPSAGVQVRQAPGLSVCLSASTCRSVWPLGGRPGDGGTPQARSVSKLREWCASGWPVAHTAC